MRTVVIRLDGKDYTVEELRSRENRAWRERLGVHFEELTAAVEGASGVELEGKALGELVRSVGGKLLGSVELVRELVVAYDDHLEPFLDDAFDSEVMEAFVGVLGLAYPFGGVLEKVRGIGGGLPLT